MSSNSPHRFQYCKECGDPTLTLKPTYIPPSHHSSPTSCPLLPQPPLFLVTSEGLYVQAGASTGLVGKIIWQATASISLRASAKLGTMGLELELGGSQRVSNFSTAGCSVVAGVQVPSFTFN